MRGWVVRQCLGAMMAFKTVRVIFSDVINDWSCFTCLNIRQGSVGRPWCRVSRLGWGCCGSRRSWLPWARRVAKRARWRSWRHGVLAASHAGTRCNMAGTMSVFVSFLFGASDIRILSLGHLVTGKRMRLGHAVVLDAQITVLCLSAES